jgi:hypothetical protein
LPAAQLPGPPGLGDIIVSGDGEQWTVLEVQRTTLSTRWRCTTRSLSVVYALDDAIVILKATYSKGVGGAAEPTWLPWLTGVRARIQPVASRIDNRHQSQQTVVRCSIFVAQNVAIDNTNRIQGPDGTIYKILGASGAEQIGQLQTIDAESTPWP